MNMYIYIYYIHSNINIINNTSSLIMKQISIGGGDWNQCSVYVIICDFLFFVDRNEKGIKAGVLDILGKFGRRNIGLG